MILAAVNDGLLVSWLAASAPFAGIGGYLLGGSLARSGFDPLLIGISLALIALIGTAIGSSAYLLGRAVATWRGRGPPISTRVALLVLCHPFAMVLIFVGWLRIGG